MFKINIFIIIKHLMNKGLIKFFLDLGPLVIFYLIYKKYGMSYAILPLIVATIISVFFVYRIDNKIPIIPVLGAIVVTVFGGLSLLFDNKIFFYMKPTIVNLIFVIVLLYGQIILKKPLLKNLFEGSIKMTDEGWNILNKRWLYFFIFLALLNEIIWRTQSEEFWVQFKVFGLIPITIIFTIMQLSLIQKYRIDQ
jgi:intracellular septation protein